MAISLQDVSGNKRRYGAAAATAEWNKAAALQDLWLKGQAHTTSSVATNRFDLTDIVGPFDSDISLNWTLRDNVSHDGRARLALGMLQAATVSNGGDELAQLKQRIDELFLASSANMGELGPLRFPAVEVASFHAQRTAFSSIQTDPLLTLLDPLPGALGSFNFYANPVAQVSKNAMGVVKIEISEVLLDALDLFDFNDEQQLGVFAEPDRVSRNIASSGTLIGNSDYRSWRVANNKRRDFLVLSDMRSVPLAFTFEYTSAPVASFA